MKTYTLKINIPVPDTKISLEEIKLTEDQVKDLIEQYNKPTHKRKYFVPKVGEEYYYISAINNRDYDKFQIQLGNCFATEQDAQDELNRRQALVRIWSDFDDKYAWEIDWDMEGQYKFGIGFNHLRNKLTEMTSDLYQLNTQLPYFKSAEDRNQFVEDNESDLLVVFNIKK